MIDPNLYWSDPAERQPLIVRYGYPATCGIEGSEAKNWEGSISQADFEQLLEPLKHIQVPPYPGNEALVCDGAIYGFGVGLGATSFSYAWHTIPPKGWESVAQWLGSAIHHLDSLPAHPWLSHRGASLAGEPAALQMTVPIL